MNTKCNKLITVGTALFLAANASFGQALVVDGDLTVNEDSFFKGDQTLISPSASTTSARLEVKSNKGVVFFGVFGTGAIPESGAGTRLMWSPFKAAFRAGKVSGVQWDSSNIGDYSIALGENTIASGSHSFAGGKSADALEQSTFAFGTQALAEVQQAIALGYQCEAKGISSFATIRQSTAKGGSSAAIGHNVTAEAWGQATFGRYNKEKSSPTTTHWTGNDYLFVVGNGNGIAQDPNEFRNAFIIHQNGDAELKNGKLTLKAQGDIPMYSAP